jgi:hypothetical protein
VYSYTGLIALAYGLTAVVVSPYLYAMFAYPQALKPPGFHGIAIGVRAAKDLLLFVVPGLTTWVGSSLATSLAIVKNPWYLGVPLLVAQVHLWITARHRLLTKTLAVGFLTGVVFALGPHLPVGGHKFPLPWRAVQLLPLLGRVRAGRLISFAFLFAGVSVAVWLSRGGRLVVRWALVALALVLLIPNLSMKWTTKVPTSQFFTTGQYRQYLSPGETVMVIDQSKGTAMYWQEEADFSFAMAGWYWGFRPPGYAYLADGLRMGRGRIRQEDEAVLRAFISAHHVRAVIFGRINPATISLVSSMLGVAPVQVGGVTVLQLTRERPEL